MPSHPLKRVVERLIWECLYTAYEATCVFSLYTVLYWYLTWNLTVRFSMFDHEQNSKLLRTIQAHKSDLSHNIFESQHVKNHQHMLRLSNYRGPAEAYYVPAASGFPMPMESPMPRFSNRPSSGRPSSKRPSTAPAAWASNSSSSHQEYGTSKDPSEPSPMVPRPPSSAKMQSPQTPRSAFNSSLGGRRSSAQRSPQQQQGSIITPRSTHDHQHFSHSSKAASQASSRQGSVAGAAKEKDRIVERPEALGCELKLPQALITHDDNSAVLSSSEVVSLSRSMDAVGIASSSTGGASPILHSGTATPHYSPQTGDHADVAPDANIVLPIPIRDYVLPESASSGGATISGDASAGGAMPSPILEAGESVSHLLSSPPSDDNSRANGNDGFQEAPANSCIQVVISMGHQIPSSDDVSGSSPQSSTSAGGGSAKPPLKNADEAGDNESASTRNGGADQQHVIPEGPVAEASAPDMICFDDAEEDSVENFYDNSHSTTKKQLFTEIDPVNSLAECSSESLPESLPIPAFVPDFPAGSDDVSESKQLDGGAFASDGGSSEATIEDDGSVGIITGIPLYGSEDDDDLPPDLPSCLDEEEEDDENECGGPGPISESVCYHPTPPSSLSSRQSRPALTHRT